MKNFYPEIILLALVAVFALMFMGGVFEPQKLAQIKMAESINQTTSSVTAGVDDTAPMVVTADQVITTINQYCRANNTSPIQVSIGMSDHIYTTSAVSSGGTSITSVVSDLTKYYTKKIDKNATGSVTRITFKQL